MNNRTGQSGRRPTILFVQYSNPDFYPTTYNLARMLAAGGYEIVICCRADRPVCMKSYGEHITIHRISKPWNGMFSTIEFTAFVTACLSIAMRSKPFLLIGYDMHGLIAAGVVGRMIGSSHFYHLYDVFLPEEGIGKFDRFLKRYERDFASSATALIIPSESKAELFLRTSKLERSVFVVANSPPLQERAPSDLLKRALAARGFAANTIVYYHGSIGSGKGLLPAVRSIPYWPRDAAFVLIGMINEAGFFAELMHEAARLGVENRVHYLGVVPYVELYDYTRSADLGLFVPETAASIHVYSGAAIVKLNDYMACGVPFLVSGIAALAELARQTGAGNVAEIGNHQKFGQTISGILTDETGRRRMADRGYDFHRRSLNLPTQYEPARQLINKICESGKPHVSA